MSALDAAIRNRIKSRTAADWTAIVDRRRKYTLAEFDTYCRDFTDALRDMNRQWYAVDEGHVVGWKLHVIMDECLLGTPAGELAAFIYAAAKQDWTRAA